MKNTMKGYLSSLFFVALLALPSLGLCVNPGAMCKGTGPLPKHTLNSCGKQKGNCDLYYECSDDKTNCAQCIDDKKKPNHCKLGNQCVYLVPVCKGEGPMLRGSLVSCSTRQVDIRTKDSCHRYYECDKDKKNCAQCEDKALQGNVYMSCKSSNNICKTQ